MTKIAGYRDLDPEEVEDINKVKEVGETLENLINYMHLELNADPRWVSIAETHFQQGLMAAVRAIAKPTNF